jgi:hypothetical protein
MIESYWLSGPANTNGSSLWQVACHGEVQSPAVGDADCSFTKGKSDYACLLCNSPDIGRWIVWG